MKNQQTKAWQQFVESLTSATRAAIEAAGEADAPSPCAPPPALPGDEDEAEFTDFLASLTSYTGAALRGVREEDDRSAAPPEPELLRFGVLECPDGEWPIVRLFKTPEGVARRLGQLEGRDVAVRPFWGVIMHFTRGPQRYLLLPDGETALSVPMYEGGPVKTVPADLLDEAEVQEDGFLGPNELVEAAPASKKAKARGRDDDDDDDDGDDDDDDDAGGEDAVL